MPAGAEAKGRSESQDKIGRRRGARPRAGAELSHSPAAHKFRMPQAGGGPRRVSVHAMGPALADGPTASHGRRAGKTFAAFLHHGWLLDQLWLLLAQTVVLTMIYLPKRRQKRVGGWGMAHPVKVVLGLLLMVDQIGLVQTKYYCSSRGQCDYPGCSNSKCSLS